MRSIIFVVFVLAINFSLKAQEKTIYVKDASRYVGKTVTICDSVYSVKEDDSVTYLSYGADYFAELTLLINKADYHKFPGKPAEMYKHRAFCITGEVVYQKFKFCLMIKDPSQLFLSDAQLAANYTPISEPSTKIETEENRIYSNVMVMPSFSTGTVGLFKYITSNLVYPQEAKSAGIRGQVIAGFIVEKDGSLSNVRVLRSLSKECDAEVIRVLRSAPKFLPGLQNDKPVRVNYTIPINVGY